MGGLFGIQSEEERVGGLNQRGRRHVPSGRWENPPEDFDGGSVFVGLREGVERFEQLLHGAVHGSSPKSGSLWPAEQWQTSFVVTSAAGGYPVPPRGLHHPIERAFVSLPPQSVKQLIHRVLIRGNPFRPQFVLAMRVTQKPIDGVVHRKDNIATRRSGQWPLVGDEANLLAMEAEQCMKLPIGEERAVCCRAENFADNCALPFRELLKVHKVRQLPRRWVTVK
jgi:hypothetical protein